MLRRSLVSAFFTLACAGVLAAGVGAQRGAPPPTATTPATALVVGRTVDSNNRPIAGVLVTFLVHERTQDLLIERRALTNGEGEFLFAGLPGGECVIRTEKEGYASEDADGRALSPDGRFFSLGAGQRLTDLAVMLVKHASISGSVTDDTGAPIQYSSVAVLRRTMVEGRPRFVPARGSMGLTDDRGRYQINGLLPDRYVVTARTSTTLKIARAGGEPIRHLTYPSAVFPQPNADGSAAFVGVSAGQMLSGVDFRLAPAPAARLSGMVRGADVTRTLVELIPDITSDISRMVSADRSIYVQADGRFIFDGVLPGSYTLRALKRPERTPNSTAEPVGWASWATTRLAMAGSDIDDVALALQPAVRISGRMETDDAVPIADLVRAAHRIDITPVDDRQPFSGQALAIADDGRFSATGFIPGRYVIRDNAWTGVRLTSVVLNGRDVFTTPFELDTRGIDGLVLTITGRRATIRGAARNGRGQSEPGTQVLLFPTEARFWTGFGERSGRIQRITVARNGSFGSPTPPGDYFVVATTDRVTDEWTDAANLQRLSSMAQVVTVSEGNAQPLNLVTRSVR